MHATSKALTVRQIPARLQIARWIGHQNWIMRGHAKLIHLLHNPYKPSPLRFEAPFFGKRYLGSLDQYLDCMVLFYGAYERPALSFLARAAKALRAQRGTVSFFDVGANLGHHSLFGSDHADAVFAFEPYAPLQAKIAEKISANGIRNIRIVPFGLGEENAELPYHPGAGTNSGAGTFLNETAGAQDRTETLTVRIGDELLDELGAPRVDILKVDVEGFEAPVFRGLRRRILTDRPVILTELGERTKRIARTEEEFRRLFYPDAKLYEVAGRSNDDNYRLAHFDFAIGQERLIAILPPEIAHGMDAKPA